MESQHGQVRDPARLPLNHSIGHRHPHSIRAASSRILMAGWAVLGLLFVAFSIALTAASPLFGYDYEVADMPVFELVAGLVLAGIVFCIALPPLITKSLMAEAATVRIFTATVIVFGLAARLVLFASEPILEDDYQRYLWDGAVTMSGEDPYAASPQSARQPNAPSAFARLAEAAGPVAERINHPELKTIYPPVAQAAFALAHILKPWSLAAWRTVLLICDVATLSLILLLLAETGRSPLWSALYWWNPLVIKELFNSAHMDAVVLPLVLFALLLVAHGRQVIASTSLAVAAGAKIWPVLLLPLVLRPLVTQNRKLAGAIMIFCGLILLWATPILLSGLDVNSGLTAYLTYWKTNSALFPAIEYAVATFFDAFDLTELAAGRVARVLIALALAGLAFVVGYRPLKNADDLMGRASFLVAALVLLSPAQFPWYTAWFAPFLAFRPWFGFLLLTATAPLYYMYFYFASADEPEVFRQYVVWLIWVPVWAALIFEVALRQRAERPM